MESLNRANNTEKNGHLGYNGFQWEERDNAIASQ